MPRPGMPNCVWAYRSNVDDGRPVVVCVHQVSRAGVHARTSLQGWCGHLMVHDYAGYDDLFTARQRQGQRSSPHQQLLSGAAARCQLGQPARL